MRGWFFRFCVLFSTLFVVSESLVAQSSNGDDDIARTRAFDYYYMQALSQKEQGNYAAALDLFEHCLAIKPAAPALLFELSPLYSYLGRDEEAISFMEKAVEGDPENFWYRQVLASYYLDNGDIDAALKVYEEIAKKETADANIFILLAGLYQENGKYDKAISAIERLERIEGSTEATALQKYNIYMLMKDKSSAVNVLQSLIRETPDDTRFSVLLGDTYMRFGDSDSALIVYDRISDSDPDNMIVQYSLCNYYRIEGNDSLYTVGMEKLLTNEKLADEARFETILEYVSYKERNDTTGYVYKLFDKLMALPYGVEETAELYADYMLMKGVGEDSVAPVLSKLLTLEPENKKAQMYMLVYALRRNNYDEVLARCDTAILYSPELLALYYYRGIACYNLKRLQDAIDTYRLGLSRCSDDTEPQLISDVYGLIGDTYHELGLKDECYQAYDSALVYESDNITILNNYAYFLALDGENLDKAEEMSSKTIKEAPDDATYIDTYAWVLFRMGRYEEAKAYALKLLNSGDELGATVYSHLGDIFAKNNEIDRAVEFWKMAQEAGDKSKILERKIKRRKYISDEKR